MTKGSRQLTAASASLPARPSKSWCPTSYVRVDDLQEAAPTQGAEGIETGSLKVKITNLSCQASSFPDDATALTTHARTGLTTNEGHLEDPFQPFGKFELCVQLEHEQDL